MRAGDKKEFLTLLADVHAFYNKDFSTFAGAVWWEALRHYDFPAVSQALSRYAVNPDSGQFMPKPADVVKMLGGTSTDAALMAWSKVDRAVRSVGQYASVVFDDALIHRVIDDMGGWVKLCSCPSEDDFVFVAKEFQTRYRGFSVRSETPDYQPVMIGLAQAQNARQGLAYNVPPRTIGDLEKCRMVYLSGTRIASLVLNHMTPSAELLPAVLENGEAP
jgi:hypothetical protein